MCLFEDRKPLLDSNGQGALVTFVVLIRAAQIPSPKATSSVTAVDITQVKFPLQVN